MKSPPDHAKLQALSRRINDREDAIQVLRKRTVQSANDTLCEVLLQGQDLIEAKARCAHGLWLPWLRANCPKVSDRSAQRYMALAARAPELAQLKEAESLRAALALCDLEGETERQEPRRWPSWQEAILRVSKLRGYVEKNPITHWPAEGVEKFRQEFEPIARAIWPERFE
ncbi:MAG TPA: hypothetical protein VG167_18850 [Verrucomicrobiae bacterium]|nr:hypothetical protein [Verrucomicrobiae bacterium]